MGSNRRSVLFVLLAIVWGSAYVGIKAGLPYFPPILYAALRYEIGGLVILIGAAVFSDRWLPRTRNDRVQIGIRALFIFAGFHVFLFLGQRAVTSAVGAVVVGMSPILTGVFATALLAETRISRQEGLGLVLGFAGVVVLAHPTPATLLSANVVGIAFVLCGAASLALGSVLTERVPMRLDAFVVTGWSMFLGALLTHGVSLLVGESVGAVEWTTKGLFWLGFIALVPGALGFYLYFALLDRVGSFETNLVQYVVPLFTALFGWLVLAEPVDRWLGGGFVLISLGFLTLKAGEISRLVGTVRSTVEESN